MLKIEIYMVGRRGWRIDFHKYVSKKSQSVKKVFKINILKGILYWVGVIWALSNMLLIFRYPFTKEPITGFKERPNWVNEYSTFGGMTLKICLEI